MKKYFVLLSLAAGLVACSDEITESAQGPDPRLKINLSGEISQEYQTRASDGGFANGDVSGVYIVDYAGNEPGTLSLSGNRANNMRLTYSADEHKWDMAEDVYFQDDHTNIDVYGYYPYAQVTSVEAHKFEVSKAQNIETTSSALGGYEASDFLWGKAENVSPQANLIILHYNHAMASAKISLIEGEGFGEGEWTELKKQVAIVNTKRNAEINLATGEVLAVGNAQEDAIIPYAKDDFFRAIVVPQTIAAGTEIFTFNVGATKYTFSKSEDLELVAGKLHNFTFTVNKRIETGDYEFKLLGESIVAWVNDDLGHDAALKEYIIINNTEPGKLAEAIQAAGKDLSQVKNLKVTGKIDYRDFETMKKKMTIKALNLKEVEIVEYLYYSSKFKANEIPGSMFDDYQSLNSIILPDKLTTIGESAFSRCSGLVGSLIIPEGVTAIGPAAFWHCDGLTGELRLPSTLTHIMQGAFDGCNFNCELSLPSNLEAIDERAFTGNKFYGNLILPEKLNSLDSGAFSYLYNLSGSLEIPASITEIPKECFAFCGFNGNLILHNGITKIGVGAFGSCQFKGSLKLPENLTSIESSAFAGNYFSGELVLPKSIVKIGSGAFTSNPRLSGIIEFPELMVSIGEGAFSGCNMLEGIILPESIETIGDGAFANCFGIGSIICNAPIPPRLNSSFDGVAKDNFAVEVPEAAVAQYKTSPEWMEFKRITAHHELVARPGFARALNAESVRNIILNAEGDWVVDSQPDWITLSQTSGTGKTELSLAISALNNGAGNRDGEIVFKLTAKDYTYTFKVEQYDYEYNEDQLIILQQATRGNNGGIDLVFLGEGYDAKDISEGKLLANIEEEVEYFFGVEPYATYRDYFNVKVAFPLSYESGIGTVNTLRDTKFETTFTGAGKLAINPDNVFEYAVGTCGIAKEKLAESTLIVIPNTRDYGGITYMYSDGSAIAICPLSDDEYPFDSRGVIQHEVGGHAFGKLGDEYIYHNAFIDHCSCPCCPHTTEFISAKNNGWYANLSLSGKLHETGWDHLMFDPRYQDIVDIYEGGFMHTRGVYRSEQNSCMNNNIPYFSTISREAIVRRIKEYAGETFDFEDFVAKDNRDPGVATRAMESVGNTKRSTNHSAPVIIEGSPLKKL